MTVQLMYPYKYRSEKVLFFVNISLHGDASFSVFSSAVGEACECVQVRDMSTCTSMREEWGIGTCVQL